MGKLVSVVIINWNGEKYLKKCLASLMETDYQNIEVIVIDNGSSDNSVKIVKEFFDNRVKIVENDNIGYAGGANKGITVSTGEYVLIANPDIIFTKDYVGNLVETLERSADNGACIGKLVKYDFDNDKVLDVIDSAGISVNHKRQGYDRGQNEVDLGQYDKSTRVFGVCGAAALFKRTALEDIKFRNEYFDEDFFAYKEDIDICWRLNLYGYKCLYVHDALAYHGRGMNSSKGVVNTIKNRRNQSEFLKGISFRNHYLMISKNEVDYTYKKDKIGIYIDAMKYLVFFLLFDFKCFKYIKEYKKLRPRILAKRSVVMKNIRISQEEIYRLFDL